MELIETLVATSVVLLIGLLFIAVSLSFYLIRIHKMQKADINEPGTSVSKLRAYNEEFGEKLKKQVAGIKSPKKQ